MQLYSWKTEPHQGNGLQDNKIMTWLMHSSTSDGQLALGGLCLRPESTSLIFISWEVTVQQTGSEKKDDVQTPKMKQADFQSKSLACYQPNAGNCIGSANSNVFAGNPQALNNKNRGHRRDFTANHQTKSTWGAEPE